jgi:hypothetical protein
MCTVTFIPLGAKNFVLTSNRDVSYKRAAASSPQIHFEHGVELLYPRDEEAGGTWIGSSYGSRLLCLLNGGFENHVRNLPYRKSRGLIVTELLAEKDLSSGLKSIDLDRIEPFTLVTVEWRDELELGQFVWDGRNKHRKMLKTKPQIWSSSTLFDTNMRILREQWFETFLNQKDLSPESILQWHKTAGQGDDNVGVVLKRKQVGTVSFTQFVRLEKSGFRYEPLKALEAE